MGPKGDLERAKGLEPSHSAWKSPESRNVLKSRSDISQPSGRLRSLRNFSLSEWRHHLSVRSFQLSNCGAKDLPPHREGHAEARKTEFVIVLSLSIRRRRQPPCRSQRRTVPIGVRALFGLCELARLRRASSAFCRGFEFDVGIGATPHHRSSRGPSATPARVHTTIVPPYQSATKGSESSVQ